MKIAFLFLTVSAIYHESYWQRFFQGHENNYSVYVHSKDPLPEFSFFKQYEIAEKKETSWSNTAHAQIALLKEALKDSENEKFIFTSETTIPLQDFRTTYDIIMEDAWSHFIYERNPHLKGGSGNLYPSRNLWPIPYDYQFKNPQWVVFNRKHAQIMVDDHKALNFIAQHGSDQEFFPATILGLHGLLHEVRHIDRTLVIWDKKHHAGKKYRDAPYHFSDLSYPDELALLTKAIEEKKYLFVRKVLPECDLKPLEPYLAYCK